MKKKPIRTPRFTQRKSQLFAFLKQATIAIVLAVLLWSCTPNEKNRVKAVEIANKTQLFLDDHIIGQMIGLERTFHKPQKKGLIKEADGSDWERGDAMTVVRDRSGRFHASYRYGWSDPSVRDLHPSIGNDKAHWFRRGYGYAISDDGIYWKKPILGLQNGPTGFRRAPRSKWKDGVFLEPTGFSKLNNLLGYRLMIKDLYQFGGLQDQQQRYLVSVTHYDDTHPFANVVDAGLYFSENVPDLVNDKDWRKKIDAGMAGCTKRSSGWNRRLGS